MARKADKSVKAAFEETGRRIAIGDIRPLKLVTDIIKKTPKYRQIAASIAEVGIVEPPVVARDRSERGKYLLLDGHLRIEVLKERGETDVVCLISTDDEAFTYNKRVNRIAIVQEHQMILKAIERGVSEERIAKSLNVDVASIRRKRRLLNGICPEAAELLKDKHVAIPSFSELKKLAPLRQIEAAELMVAMNKYTISYAKSLVAATPQAQLADGYKSKAIKREHPSWWGGASYPSRFGLHESYTNLTAIGPKQRYNITGMSRDSPDESQTGSNDRVFPALLQDRREVRTPTGTLGQPECLVEGLIWPSPWHL